MLKPAISKILFMLPVLFILAGCNGNAISTPGIYSGPGGSSFATAVAPNYAGGTFDKYSFAVNYCDIYYSIDPATAEQWYVIPSVTGGYGITVSLSKQSGDLPITIYGEIYDASGSRVSGGGEIQSSSSGLSTTFYLAPSTQNYALRIHGNGSKTFGFKATVIYGGGVSF
ncbi:MAG: hypothetical protein AABZ57_07005 [Candidatus Margulisiibacteriota bacterium]